MKDNINLTLSPKLQNGTLFEEGFFNSDETYIHPTSIVGPNVKLESGVKVGPYCVILGDTRIGTKTRIAAYVTIGFPAQDVKTKDSKGRIIIGKNCEIREFVSIHASKSDIGETKIGDDCYIMNFCHVSHDVKLGSRVTLINSVNLGGHVEIADNVMVMANGAMHQFCKIGRFSCLTPFSATRQDITPFCMFTGMPARFSGLNLIALKRANFSRNDIDALKHVTKLFFQDKDLLDTIKEKANAEKSWGQNIYVQEFIQFIENSIRGVSRREISYSKEPLY